jgi:hypothetical protein
VQFNKLYRIVSARNLMRISSLMRDWLRRPSRITLTVGLGALAAATPKATEAEAYSDRVPQQSVRTFGELSIWSEDGHVCVAEPGAQTRKLALGDTPEARRLRDLLERGGATAASPRTLHDRIILVGGGGDGFHWTPVQRPASPNNAGVSTERASNTSTYPNSTPSVRQSEARENSGVETGNRKK